MREPRRARPRFAPAWPLLIACCAVTATARAQGFSPSTWAAGAGPQALVLADLDADGQTDLAEANQFGGDVWVDLGGVLVPDPVGMLLAPPPPRGVPLAFHWPPGLPVLSSAYLQDWFDMASPVASPPTGSNALRVIVQAP